MPRICRYLNGDRGCNVSRSGLWHSVIANVLNVGCKDIRGYCSEDRQGVQGLQAEAGGARAGARQECPRCQHGLRTDSKSFYNEQIQLIYRDCPWTFKHFFSFSHRLWCLKIQGPEADFDRTLAVAVGVVSVRFWSNFDAYLWFDIPRLPLD